MNLEFVKQILMKKLEGGRPLAATIVDDCFRIASEFEKKAMEKGYIVPDFCNNCGGKLKAINVSTAKERQIRVQCEGCQKNAIGKTEREAIYSLWGSK